MANLRLERASKSYGAVHILHGIDLEIADGEFVVLIGPSGCGKSTLLRMIAGLEEISGGNIFIADQRVNDLAPRKRDIAMVFQNYALYPHMTVAENMAFSMRLRKENPAAIKAAVDRAADMLGLQPLLERFPRALSGGQRQRVAMGRALVRNPAAFLFDEPLSNLDAKLRVQMRSEIKTLQQRLGTTLVYVTHDQSEAMTMADRIVVLNHGRIEQVGAPLDLYDRPANVFVAGFIGSPAINLIEGQVAGEVVKVGNAVLPLPPKVKGGPADQVTYGIRPEHLAILPGGQGTAATVVLVEPNGADTQVIVDLQGQQVRVLTRDRVKLAPGAAIGLQIDASAVHLFAGDTGLRIN